MRSAEFENCSSGPASGILKRSLELAVQARPHRAGVGEVLTALPSFMRAALSTLF